MPRLTDILKIAALFLIVVIAIVLYQVTTVRGPETNLETSLPSGELPIISRVAPDLLIINNLPIQLDLADTKEKQTLGLSGRTSLSKEEGMLFIFDQPKNWGFWMKEMFFPIDIIWLDDNYQPVYVVQNVQPESYPRTFYPPAPARYVLEVNAGVWQEALLSTD